MTPNDFLKIIQQEENPIEEIPNGWHNTTDLSKMWGMGISVVQKKIKTGKKLGYVTEKKFLIKRDRLIRVPYYKFHEKEDHQKKNQRTNLENTIRSRRKN